MARRKKKNSTLETILIIIILAVSIYTTLTQTSTASSVSGKLEVQFIDVGQADSILIRTEDKNVLIDAGNNEDGPKLVEYFTDLGITSFEYVVGTHAHEDHIGGMDDIINSFDINTFYMPDAITTTKTFEDVLDSLDAKGYKFDVPKIGNTFKVGEAIFKVIYTGTDTKDLNNTSIILRMDHGNNSFLFTGDATTTIEKEILDSNIDVDVLKVAHHGSSYATSAKFINAVTPKYAVISVGKNNIYNHPVNTILKRLEASGATIYRTDIDGTIIMESDGNDLVIKKVETETNG